ncbi:MAG: DUF4230 domain-containing protein [Bacteroidota bacterium]
MKKIIYGIMLLLFFGMGVYLTQKYYAWSDLQAQEQSQVLLEKVKNVYKLVTVEGHFSEVYDYQDYWGYDLSFFRKKALIRVKATVLVGYNLEKMEIEAHPEEKKIVISQLPDPAIISVEHDLDYYDITEGTFNSFTKDDYNQLNAKAKAFILQKAQESDLLNAARQQGNQAVEMMIFLVKSAGWTLEYKKGLVNQETLDAILNN